MKILVTGAAGFIGSNLADSLIRAGHEVVGLDNLSQGDRLNVKALEKNERFKFTLGDVLDQQTLSEASRGCEAIFHLAAFKIPRYGNAYDTLRINSRGTELAIDAAVDNGAHLIFASTSDVYGKNPNVPFSEEHDLVIGPPTVKRWAYAVSKAFDEQMCFAEAARRKLKFTIVRFFGGYGPHQNLTWWGGPQSVFIGQALDDSPLTIHGDGSQTRSFTYIQDHVDGLLSILERPGAVGEVFNLGNGREIRIIDLAKMIWSLVRPGNPPKIECVPYERFGKYEDVVRRVPDTRKAKSVLGFESKWSLEKGLPITIDWQRKRRAELAPRT